MTRKFVTVTLITLAAAHSASSQGQAPAAPSPTLSREIIPLYMSQKRILVMLRLGDSMPFPVVWDTGTNGNLIDTKMAKQLGLPNTGPSPSIDGSTGKPVPGFDTFIKGASLSGIAIPDARATALDYNLSDEIGIFGPNSFPDKLVRMEGIKSRLVVLQKTKENTPLCAAFPYLGKNGDALPSAVVEMDGLKISAILDSGNDSSIILPNEYIEKLTLLTAPVKIGTTTSAAGTQPIFSAHLKGNMKIGDAVLESPEIRFIAGGRPNVGLPILRNLTVVMDPSSGQDWVLSADPKSGTCNAEEKKTTVVKP